LWLRGERAFGLDALPLTVADGTSWSLQPAHEADGPMPTPPGAGATVATAQPTPGTEVPRPRSTNLFGATEPPAAAMRAAGLAPAPSSDEPFSSPILSIEGKRIRLLELDEREVRGCTMCRLCESRTHTVFGEGDAGAQIFFIGEGPGETEDRTGRPFVGRAGELLDRMINAMGLKREQVYIANIVKCRPPGNREPSPDEVATCTPYLVRQLEIIRPRVIVTLGRPALQYMLNQKIAISRMRGQWQTWRGIRLMPTFHPAYILRSYTNEVRAAVWGDLQQVMDEVGLPRPRAARGATKFDDV
jgi:DNA polymerase